MLIASVCAPSPPQLSSGTRLKLQIKRSDRFGDIGVRSRLKPTGLGLELQHIDGRSRKQYFSVICAAAVALNATCSASGQTQTVTREAPTITQAPVHSKQKSPQLDDGDSGFPGENWSGGFFLIGFLAFLGFLKDKESEEDYWDSRRR